MPSQQNIDSQIETVITNSSDTDFHMLCIFKEHTINEPPQISSPIFVDVVENTEYVFDPDIILNAYLDAEGNAPWQVKVIETVDVGALRFGDNDIIIINNQVIEWDDFNSLKWSPLENQSGVNYASLKLVIKDDGEVPRCYSNIIEIVFNVTTENQEPTVSDSCIETDYASQITLTADLFTQDYYDPETNSLDHILIESLPPSGEGVLLYQNNIVTPAQLPLEVSTSELLAGDLVYLDTGEIIVEKLINITFSVFDNVT